MIKSMTGFSKAEVKESGTSVSIEAKSLNGRNLELNIRMPRNLSNYEQEARQIIKENVARGTVSIFVNLENEDLSKAFKFNSNAAEAIYKSLTDLKKALKIKETVTMTELLAFSADFYQKEKEDTGENDWKLVKKALINALKELDKSRAKEGANIQKDIEKRVKKIHETVKKIELLGRDRVPAEVERLKDRIAQLFDNEEIDEQRLQMEIVLMADKLDISEECTRLLSHLKLFYETIKETIPIGQKLTFVLQEMHREINTIGSKINDAAISHLVVSLKEEVERIREQVQNIE